MVSVSLPKWELRRTGWDVLFGGLLVIGGLVILGDAAFATTVSVLFIGWILVIYGVVGLVAALFFIGTPGFWPAALSGGLMLVLGLLFLRHTGAAAVTLTLLAGIAFLTAGIVRLIAAAHEPDLRVPLVFSGVASAVLGLIVLFDLFDATYTLLGTLLGIYAIVDGISLMVSGRWRLRSTPASAGA